MLGLFLLELSLSYCRRAHCADWADGADPSSQYILPGGARYLEDPDNQVRKPSQEALLALLEQGLISQCDIEG